MLCCEEGVDATERLSVVHTATRLIPSECARELRDALGRKAEREQLSRGIHGREHTRLHAAEHGARSLAKGPAVGSARGNHGRGRGGKGPDDFRHARLDEIAAQRCRRVRLDDVAAGAPCTRWRQRRLGGIRRKVLV